MNSTWEAGEGNSAKRQSVSAHFGGCRASVWPSSNLSSNSERYSSDSGNACKTSVSAFSLRPICAQFHSNFMLLSPLKTTGKWFLRLSNYIRSVQNLYSNRTVLSGAFNGRRRLNRSDNSQCGGRIPSRAASILRTRCLLLRGYEASVG